jgi:uncharacterized membrane protein
LLFGLLFGLLSLLILILHVYVCARLYGRFQKHTQSKAEQLLQ